MATLPSRRGLLTVLLVMAALTAVLWAVVLLGSPEGAVGSMLRGVAWVMLVLTGGTAIGLRDANRAMEKGMRTPPRPPRDTPPAEDTAP
ncbi:hypothetical protein [Oryzobacter telluris]|uniref:hypothetical protein n=1 Tax=Oryzobacter telluris TaxID=3149179 RepID=UPI00370DDC34